MKFFELLKNTKSLIIFAITCIVVCFVGKYRDFDFVEVGTFKLSFDFMFFAALVGAVVSSVILVWKTVGLFFSWIKSFSLLKILKNCTPEEKDFLYNRVYANGNELHIDMNSDCYFYEEKPLLRGGFTYNFYRQEFDTKEKVIKFLRQLEIKDIIRNGGNQSMVIPQQVWSVLVKNSDKIFNKFQPLPIFPTVETVKCSRILYNTMSKEHKIILKKIMNAPSTEYINVKVLDNVLASQANLLKQYVLLNDFQVDFLANVCMATFPSKLYTTLEILLNEDNDENFGGKNAE